MKYTLLLLGLVTVGCRHLDYAAFDGDPKHDWPAGPDTFVKKVNGIDFYHSPPPRPYTVLGRCVEADVNEHDLAKLARQHHGDAVVIIDEKSENRGIIHDPGMVFWGGGWAWAAPDKTHFDLHVVTCALIVKYRL